MPGYTVPQNGHGRAAQDSCKRFFIYIADGELAVIICAARYDLTRGEYREVMSQAKAALFIFPRTTARPIK